MKRAAFFIDGFNLYHALDRLGWNPRTQIKSNHYKWLDLDALARRLISPRSEQVSAIHYFSALAHWLPAPLARHQEYIKALRARNVNIVLGHFKEKDRGCKTCGAKWQAHEEKETDVNIGIWMFREAYRNNYDVGYLISRDSDQKPTVDIVQNEFQNIQIVIVAPPELGHSNDLIQAANGGKKKIRRDQIEQCLFPETVLDAETGQVIATRPGEYAPPR